MAISPFFFAPKPTPRRIDPGELVRRQLPGFSVSLPSAFHRTSSSPEYAQGEYTFEHARGAWLTLRWAPYEWPSEAEMLAMAPRVGRVRSETNLKGFADASNNPVVARRVDGDYGVLTYSRWSLSTRRGVLITRSTHELDELHRRMVGTLVDMPVPEEEARIPPPALPYGLSLPGWRVVAMAGRLVHLESPGGDSSLVFWPVQDAAAVDLVARARNLFDVPPWVDELDDRCVAIEGVVDGEPVFGHVRSIGTVVSTSVCTTRCKADELDAILAAVDPTT